MGKLTLAGFIFRFLQAFIRPRSLDTPEAVLAIFPHAHQSFIHILAQRRFEAREEPPGDWPEEEVRGFTIRLETEFLERRHRFIAVMTEHIKIAEACFL